MANPAIILQQEKSDLGAFEFLPIVALAIDLFTPLPIWRNVLPSSIRWGSHIAVALMIAVSVLRMIAYRRVPRSFWVIIAACMLWAYVAMGNGQGLTSTLWGVWLLIQFPFVGLFIYLQPSFPRELPRYLRNFCLWILGLQLLVQLAQYAGGVRPGDSLSGLFGENGTGVAAEFSLLVCCLYFGFWLESGRWKGLALVLGIAIISSVLGEEKLVPAVGAVIGLAAMALYALKYHRVMKMLLLLVVLAMLLVGFGFLYDQLVPGADVAPIEGYFTNSVQLSQYLNHVDIQNNGGSIYVDIGRDFAVQLGWDTIQTDPITFFFGYGIGSRSESKSLGSAGVAITSGDLGWSVGTSLLVFMQEMGLLGLTLLAAFIVWIVVSMFRDIGKYPLSPALGTRYAVLFFSALWPVWLYYAVSWTMRVPMLLYWLCVGYVMAESRLSAAGQDRGSFD